MKQRIITRFAVVALQLLALPAMVSLGGCAAAAVGAAGAGGGIAYSDRGAKGQVKGSVDDVNARAREVFREMGIEAIGTEMKQAGKERDLEGRTGSTDVTVQIKSTGKDMAYVEVIAKEGTFKWNKDYAKQVLSKIVARS